MWRAFLHMIQVLAMLAGRAEAGLALVAELEQQIAACRRDTTAWTQRPKVYFEEWNEPLMSGIGWGIGINRDRWR